MTGKRVVVYDLPSIGLVRYAGGIAHAISRIDPSAQVTLAFDDEVGATLEEVRRATPQEIDIVDLQRRPTAQLAKLPMFQDVDAIITMAPRLPDYRVARVAASAGAIVAEVQHGLYVEFMQREASLWLSRFGKALWYGRCAFEVGACNGRGSLRTLIASLDHFAFGGRACASAGVPGTAPDVVYAYGNFWQDFYKRNYGYGSSEFVHTGYPDLERVSERVQERGVRADLCYVCQSLVEDGRIERAAMEAFLDELADFADAQGLKIAFKLHPRSDLTLYHQFQQPHELMHEGLPEAPVWIGHYSSLLAAGYATGAKVLLVDLDGHTIPVYFSDAASAHVSASSGALEQGYREACASAPSSELEAVFPVPSGPVAEQIAEDLFARLGS